MWCCGSGSGMVVLWIRIGDGVLLWIWIGNGVAVDPDPDWGWCGAVDPDRGWWCFGSGLGMAVLWIRIGIGVLWIRIFFTMDLIPIKKIVDPDLDHIYLFMSNMFIFSIDEICFCHARYFIQYVIVMQKLPVFSGTKKRILDV